MSGEIPRSVHRAFPRQRLRFVMAVAALLRRLTRADLTRCPVCRQGRMHVVAAFRSGAGPIAALDTE